MFLGLLEMWRWAEWAEMWDFEFLAKVAQRNRVQVSVLVFMACFEGAGFGQGTEPAQPASPAVEKKKAFQFEDGDRVVLIGSTVMEREQRYSCFEPRLALALGDKVVTVRNLAWSGDTVFGHARSYFGPPQEGMDRLKAHVELLKPTVVVLCYGSELAFEGLAGLPEFLTGYRKLLDLFRAKVAEVRFVIVAPPPLESLSPPLPDLEKQNRNLLSLRDALGKFAQAQDAVFVDWFGAMGGMPKPGRTANPLTENGVHYQAKGYDRLAEALVTGLGLKIPEVGQGEMAALKKEVGHKDELFFNRWRPQNETYLFGFRKHEQGQNAKEIPMFDPLIEAADKRIQELKRAALATASRL